jgi:hypothetical protein
VIQPLDYSIVIERAKSRLLKLYDRVKGAPFLEHLEEDFSCQKKRHRTTPYSILNKFCNKKARHFFS